MVRREGEREVYSKGRKRIIYCVPTVRVWKISLESSHVRLICICIYIFKNVLWIMDLCMDIGASRLKGTMEP